MKAIADLESYPDWINEYKKVEVLEATDDGYPKKARMLMDATIFKDTLIMNYEWPADRESLSWTLESSSLLKSLKGSYILAPKGSGTDVTYELAVDLAVPMIGMLKRKAERRLIDGALKDLKKRVEG
jgi:ribosome-associated toxin RatA of RatAB toxin-antitoxin module